MTQPQDWAEEKAKEIVKVLWFCNEETTELVSFKLDQERVANALREAEQRGYERGFNATVEAILPLEKLNVCRDCKDKNEGVTSAAINNMNKLRAFARGGSSSGSEG